MSVWAGVLADLVVVLHLGFILFAIGGGLLALRFPRAPWVHLPLLTWASLTQFLGWTCPLTPLENTLRTLSGRDVYGDGFIDHYIVPLVYPPGLTAEMQWGLGALLLAVNAAIYTWLIRRRPLES